MGHYSLDVDIDSLSAAKAGFEALADHLTTHSDRATASPGEIGTSWTGGAATAIKSEMTGLGSTTKQFAPKFTEAAEAVGVFITAAQACQDTIDSLNTQYDTANRQAGQAQQAAQRSHDQIVGNLDSADAQARTDADSALGVARGNAASTLRSTLQGIAFGYDEAMTTLRAAATTLGEALRSATVVAVPDETVSAYTGGGDTTSLLAALRRAATESMEDALTLTHDRQEQQDGAAAADAFDEFSGSGPRSEDEVQAFLAQVDVNSEAFRQAFLDNMDPQSLIFLQQVAHTGVDAAGAQSYGEVITAVSRMMALGSNESTQSSYLVRSDFYTDWQQAAQDWDANDSGLGHLFIAEVVQAGQGDSATWGATMLADITDRTIAFERRMQEENPTFSWGQVVGVGSPAWPTAAGRSLVGDVPGQADAVAMLFDALGEDPDAAHDVLTDADHRADTELLHYLYVGRTAQGHWQTWGSTLGETLDAATTFVGPGAEGTKNFASAEIVADLVKWYGEHPDRYPLLMNQSIVNILGNHVQALNYAGSDDTRTVGGNHPDGLLQYQQIALANLDPDDVSSLLTMVFGEDYYAQHGESADPSKGFPMYQQLSAAQNAGFRRDFLDIAAQDPLDHGRLEQLALQQGLAGTDLAHNLRDALTAQGASEDQATADARAAVDFVLGLGIDKLPVDKLGGVGGVLGGAAIDGVKDAALSAVFPDRHLTEQANAEGLSVQDYMRRVVPLEYVNMLDESGILAGDRSPEAWAAEHPGEASFVQGGELVDLADLYAHRAERPDQWQDFLFYYQEQGQSALNDLDLSEQFALGFLTSDDDHGGSGG